MMNNTSLKNFLDSSPTAFHAAAVISSALEEAGYRQLDESAHWELKSGQGYYVIRDGRAVIAFIPGHQPPAESGFRITAAHLDSPLWKVKTEGAVLEKGVWRLPVEAYGSLIHHSWMDRELEAAGMVAFMDSGRISFKHWRSANPIAIIPSLAIHMNRDVNKGVELNAQTHMSALMPEFDSRESIEDEVFNPLVAEICNGLDISVSDYLSSEIYLVPSEKASFLGSGGEQLIVSGRLDNLAMSHALLESLPVSENVQDSSIMAIWFDAEEVGNKTLTGALSLFPDEIIERIVLNSGGSREELMRSRRQSFMVSADMAHAVHPNYSDRHDPSYAPMMGGGPVLKSHGLKHYATDVFSEGRIIQAANQTDMTLQKFIIRSDLSCGYTLGPLASSSMSISTVDIGNPLWAMHSARETASMSDHYDMVKLLAECLKT